MAYAPGWYTVACPFDSVSALAPTLTTPVLEYRRRGGSAGATQVNLITGATAASSTNADGTARITYTTTSPILLDSPGTWVLRHYSTTAADRCRRSEPTEIVILSDGFTD